MNEEPNLRPMTADIVAAYVGSRNHVAASEVANLIDSVHRALAALTAAPAPQQAKPEPAVPLRKAVQPDHVTCLFDGREFKSLRRHLENEHGMSPQQYREYWGLPKDSPVVAPNYAATRSALAVAAGLGQGRRAAGRDLPPPSAGDTPPVAAPRRRGRPPKGS